MPKNTRAPSVVGVCLMIFMAACTNAGETSDTSATTSGGSTQDARYDVCPAGCHFSQLGPALDASHDGDTITVGPGTFRGGISVRTSVSIVGAGAGSTILRGGGPVVTIGEYEAIERLTVSLDGMTITGGLARSSDVSMERVDEEGVIALGGGVEIPQGAGRTVGATVTITDSEIIGNQAAPSRTASSPSGASCPDGDCLFAQAAGGGIDNWGTLTLVRTEVSGNIVGAVPGVEDLASDAQGGGIMSWLGDVTIIDSQIDGNAATARAPNGRFAEGGGVFFAEMGSLTIRNSSVSGNRARLDAAFPASVEMAAQPGGIFVNGDVSRVNITNTQIDNNAAIMTNSLGDASAWAAGINVLPGLKFVMRGSTISNNHVLAETTGAKGDAHGDSGGGDLLGTIVDTHIEGNTVIAISHAGSASAAIGGLLHEGVLTRSEVSDNTIRAVSVHGPATLYGAGLVVGWEPLTVRQTVVRGNVARAVGRDGFARGGGIFDGPTPWGVPGSDLTLIDSAVRGNVIHGSRTITLHGGGLYIDGHPMITRGRWLIEGNTPDQVFRLA